MKGEKPAMSPLSYFETRKEMTRIAKSLWKRRLTNAAGGNFAVRVGDGLVLITPSLMAERKHCALKAKDLLLIDYEKNIIEGEGALSREADMHVGLLRAFKGIGAVMHAHPFYSMAFVAQSKEIPSFIEATADRGSVACLPYARLFSPELPAQVLKYFGDHRGAAESRPLGVILPLHGLVVTGPDLYSAYSMLELIECDAFCGLSKSLV
jgi:L-fuculose-phosphate aldolase